MADKNYSYTEEGVEERVSAFQLDLLCFARGYLDLHDLHETDKLELLINQAKSEKKKE